MLRILFFYLSFVLGIHAQTLPTNRQVDWSLAGLINPMDLSNATTIDVTTQGLVGDGVTPNDTALANILSSLSGSQTLIKFPAGTFLFNQTIDLPSHVALVGEGVSQTTLSFNLSGSGNSIQAIGSMSATQILLTATANKDTAQLQLASTSGLAVGDWIKIGLDDSSLVTSTWASNTVGQIAKIKDISGNTITLYSPLRIDFDLSLQPYVQKITPKENISIKCLKIERLDDTAPTQTSAIAFNFVVNAHIKAIESDKCTFSHVNVNNSSNIFIEKSFFHEAFDYGPGGRAYGVMLQSTTGEVLVENNVFQTLRHAMILQSGANGNVFAYNYSTDATRTEFPADAAGDMVLHGNYPYANLFEQNVGENMIIDNSHGPNGPYNTFFRNRGTKYGLVIEASNSPNQNLLGNEITNTGFPYSLVNYTINGTGHFIHGNNNKGTITPTGTNALPEKTLYQRLRLANVPNAQWGGIGVPSALSTNTIPAQDNFLNNTFFDASCTSTMNQTSRTLVPITTDGTWTYYGEYADAQYYLVGIEHQPSGGNTNAFVPGITIKTLENDGNNRDYWIQLLGMEAALIHGEYWDFSLQSGSLNGFVNVRLFPNQRDTNSFTSITEDWKNTLNSQTASGNLWIKTTPNTLVNPMTQLDEKGLQTDIKPLGVPSMGTINRQVYYQFNEVNELFNTSLLRAGRFTDGEPVQYPDNPLPGTIFYNSNTATFEGFNGTIWVPLSGS